MRKLLITLLPVVAAILLAALAYDLVVSSFFEQEVCRAYGATAETYGKEDGEVFLPDSGSCLEQGCVDRSRRTSRILLPDIRSEVVSRVNC